jgi:hypothetical protein
VCHSLCYRIKPICHSVFNVRFTICETVLDEVSCLNRSATSLTSRSAPLEMSVATETNTQVCGVKTGSRTLDRLVRVRHATLEHRRLANPSSRRQKLRWRDAYNESTPRNCALRRFWPMSVTVIIFRENSTYLTTLPQCSYKQRTLTLNFNLILTKLALCTHFTVC